MGSRRRREGWPTAPLPRDGKNADREPVILHCKERDRGVQTNPLPAPPSRSGEKGEGREGKTCAAGPRRGRGAFVETLALPRAGIAVAAEKWWENPVGQDSASSIGRRRRRSRRDRR